VSGSGFYEVDKIKARSSKAAFILHHYNIVLPIPTIAMLNRVIIASLMLIILARVDGQLSSLGDPKTVEQKDREGVTVMNRSELQELKERALVGAEVSMMAFIVIVPVYFNTLFYLYAILSNHLTFLPQCTK
jgi:hypothetical protein